MDICLVDTEKGFDIHPKSVHGILWLQTHFEDEYWDALAKSQVSLPKSDAIELSHDAEQAGLLLNYVSSISKDPLSPKHT